MIVEADTVNPSTATFLPRFSDARDIDEFVEVLGRFERGEISSEDFRRYRLTRGVYGQRQEGVQMLRVKIPGGVLGPAALRALGEVADRWGHGHGNVTTRQNLQFHFIQMSEVEAAMRLLDEAGLTTREACGNTVRTITASPLSGIHPSTVFDVTPYAEALTRFFLRAPWANSLPRKFKIAFAAGPNDPAMVEINDVGLSARLHEGQRGFKVTVAGGLSTSPQNALVFFEFLPVGDLLDACEAIARVFDRMGNRDNKHRARLKYVLRKLGPEAFLATLREEYAAVKSRGGTPLTLDGATGDPTPPPPSERDDAPATRGSGYLAWRASNTFAQVQPGYTGVFVRLPVGAITGDQLRALADLSLRFGDGSVRTTIEQNAMLRFVPTERLPALHAALTAAGLGLDGARTVRDVTSCPGAESCNLAVTSSRALAASISARLEGDAALADAVEAGRDTVIKISGCPNSCGQHHIADLGFHGAARKFGDRTAPVYQLHLGGGFDAQGARFGRQVIKIPARRVAESVARLLTLYAQSRQGAETASAFFARVEADVVTRALGDLAQVDAHTDDATFLDLGEEVGFKVAIGAGECAA